MDECPGHFGHIELARKVYHIGLLEYVIKVLRTVCFNCSKLLIAREKISDELKYLIFCKDAKKKFNFVYNNCFGKEGKVCD